MSTSVKDLKKRDLTDTTAEEGQVDSKIPKMSANSNTQILNQLCAKNKIVPVYTEGVVSGAYSHIPVYRCKVKIVFGNNTYEAEAEGGSKRLAKQNVAEVFLREQFNLVNAVAVNATQPGPIVNPPAQNATQSVQAPVPVAPAPTTIPVPVVPIKMSATVAPNKIPAAISPVKMPAVVAVAPIKMPGSVPVAVVKGVQSAPVAPVSQLQRPQPDILQSILSKMMGSSTAHVPAPVMMRSSTAQAPAPVMMQMQMPSTSAAARSQESKENIPMMQMDEFTNYAQSGNPIADLLTMCQQNDLPYPKYSDGKLVGLEHNPILIVGCRVGTLSVDGAYSKVKLSKRIAADKMIKLLIKYKTENGNFDGLDGSESSMNVEEQREIDNVIRLVDIAHKNPKRTYRAPFNYEDPKFLSEVAREEQEFKLFCQTLRTLYTGKAYQSLLVKFDACRQYHPLNTNPIKELRQWMSQMEGGVHEFFKCIGRELKFYELEWSHCPEFVDKQKKQTPGFVPSMMVVLSVKIPEFPQNRVPTAINFHIKPEVAEELCMVDVISYLGMVGTRSHPPTK